MKKNLPERDTLKPEQVEAGFYVIADDDRRDDRTEYFIGQVMGSDLKNRDDFIVKSKAPQLQFWLTTVGVCAVVNITYLVRKATDLEVALS